MFQSDFGRKSADFTRPCPVDRDFPQFRSELGQVRQSHTLRTRKRPHKMPLYMCIRDVIRTPEGAATSVLSRMDAKGMALLFLLADEVSRCDDEE
jgi:hypothetical protein